MSSRLAQDSRGRLVVVVTATCDASLRVGETFLVVGNDMPVNEVGFRWLGTSTGRRPDLLERTERRTPGATLPRAKPVAVSGDNPETTPRPHQDAI